MTVAGYKAVNRRITEGRAVLLGVEGIREAIAQPRLWLTTSTLWPSGSRTNAP
jgi:hypothetical protein